MKYPDDEFIWQAAAEAVWAEIVDFLQNEHGYGRLGDLSDSARTTVTQHIATRMRSLQ